MKKLLFMSLLFLGTLVFSQDCYIFNKTVDMDTKKVEYIPAELCFYENKALISLYGIKFKVFDYKTEKDRVYILAENPKKSKVLFVFFEGERYIDVYSEDVDVKIRLYKD